MRTGQSRLLVKRNSGPPQLTVASRPAGEVGHGEVMAAAYVYLEVREQRGVVERAGHLAYAAADLLHDLAAGNRPRAGL